MRASNDQVLEWFARNAKSFRSHTAYNEARRWATKNGVCPPEMLTDDERMSLLIEERDTRSHDAKSNLVQELALLRAKR